MITNHKPPILITGAGRRIGLHIANRLLDDGHRIIAHYHQPTPGIESLINRGATTIQASLDKTEETFALIKSVSEATSALRAIVHNASAFKATPAEASTASKLFHQFFQIHMLAPYLLNVGLAEQLRANPGSNPTDIVHITDIFAVNPKPEFNIYCATKAGLENLSQSLAKQLAPTIKVNSLQPGPILFKDSHTESMRHRVIQETPLGYEGGPEVIYQALRFVLDNNYITGASIPVDGGRHLSS